MASRLVFSISATLLSASLLTTFASAAPTPNMTISERSSTPAPTMDGRDFPDPSIIRLENGFYAFATNAIVGEARVNVQMAHSSDFGSWAFAGAIDALPTLPAWVDPANPRVWAPDVVQVASNNFVMYYTAALKKNNALHCLGVATSTRPQGPYTPTSDTPWACPTAQGGAIDPAGYYDPEDGTRWVVYKIDGNAIGHGGNCNNGIAPIVSTPIVIQQVSAVDGYTPIGSPSEPLITNGVHDGPVVEAPSLTRMSDGTHVIFFSSNCFATPPYDVSYATSRSIKGPYTKYGPLLVMGDDGLVAPGGLDIAINGNHAVFHADYHGGRAMFTAIISGTNPVYTAHVR